MIWGLAAAGLYAAAVCVLLGATRWLRAPAATREFLLLAALPLLFLSPGVLRNRTILPLDHLQRLPPSQTQLHRVHNHNLNDPITQFVPFELAARRAWSAGEVPLRNRWEGCGTPLAANGQSAVFSPATLLLRLLPIPWAFNLLVAWKLLLALTGMALWLRDLGVTTAPRVYGAIAFAFSMTMTPWLLFPHTSVIALWPWALFLLDRLRHAGIWSRVSAALLALFVFWAVAGHLESVASFVAFWFVFEAGRLWTRTRPRPPILSISAVAAAAVGLSAFALLPQWLAIASSNRIAIATGHLFDATLSWVPHGPAWPGGFLTVLLPRAFGDAIRSPMIAGAAGSFPEMALGYAGITTVALVLASFLPAAGRGAPARALRLPLLVGFAMAVGLWPFAEMLVHVPGLRWMMPLRLLSWIALAGSAIAALELDRLAATRQRRAALALAATCAVVAGAAFLLFERVRPLHVASGGIASEQNALRLAGGALVLLFLLALVAAARPRLAPAVPALAAVVLLAELMQQGRRLYRFEPPAALDAVTPMTAFLRERPGAFRVLGEGAYYFPASGVFAEVEEVRTHEPVERRDYVTFLDRHAGYPPSDYFKFVRNLDAPVLDFLNVRYLASHPDRQPESPRWRVAYRGPDGTLLENTRALPRVFAPRRAIGQGGTLPEAPVGVADWSEKAWVVLPGIAPGRTLENPEVRVEDYRETTNTAQFRIARRSPVGAVLVASLVQDGGWRAEDGDGSRLVTGLANGPFLAIVAPPGVTRVRLRYTAPGMRPGLLLTGATAVLLLIGAFSARRRRSGGVDVPLR
jgi:hypothetical protein